MNNGKITPEMLFVSKKQSKNLLVCQECTTKSVF